MKRQTIATMLRKLSRLTVRLVLPAVVLVVTMLWLKGAFRHDRVVNQPDTMPAAQMAPAGAEILTVAESPREVVTEMVGEVKPEFEIKLSSKVTAHILRLDIRAGQHVRKGEVLAILDGRDLQARVNQASQSLIHAQATRAYAQLDWGRNHALYDKGAIPKAEFDVADTTLKAAQAEVDRLQQALDEAKVNLGYTEIDSPIDGIVIDREADVGDLAMQGKTLLVLFDPKHLWFQGSVSEEYVPLLKLDQTYRVQIDALRQDFSGPLTEIVPSADPSGRTVLARIRLPVDDRLYPGLFGRLRLAVSQTQDILVPRRALRRAGQLEMVTVQAPWGLEQRVEVPGLAMEREQVQILTGLKPGERILLPPEGQERRP